MLHAPGVRLKRLFASTTLDRMTRIGCGAYVETVNAVELLIDLAKPEANRVINEQSMESLQVIGRNFVDSADVCLAERRWLGLRSTRPNRADRYSHERSIKGLTT